MGISSLKEIIEMDLERDGSYDRYPVRFLSMRYEDETSDTLIQLKRQMNGVEIFDIKDILSHEDAWITPHRLRKELQDLDPVKSFIVVGISEYARFLSQEEFETLLISFLELENSDNPKRRIYIICFALYSQIRKTIKIYHRRVDVYNPLLNETDIEDLPRIFFVGDRLNVDNYANEVKNSAEWFGMWRNSNINTKKPIICSSKTLSYFYTQASPDNIYNIQYVKTYEDVLKYMYSIVNLYAYKKDPEGFFSKFITLLKFASENDVANIILSEVNAQYINDSNIYWLWRQNDTFKRWLIQNFVLVKLPEHSYLYKVMLSLEELSDKEFLEKMYESIFDYKDAALVDERKRILESIKKVEKDVNFSDRMVSYYNKIFSEIVYKKTSSTLKTIDFTVDNESFIENRDELIEALDVDAVPYLTCYSKYERQFITWLYRAGFIVNEQVKNIYPNLWNYLNGTEKDLYSQNFAQKCSNYFDTYRKLRLAQEEEEVYNDRLNEWNKDENTFYGWYFNDQIEYPEVYLKKSGFKGNVYVLDGVGAEFMGYLLKLLEEKGYLVESSSYCKCHLPSITTVAQEYYPLEYKWISDFDAQVIHGETYYPVQNIEKALTVIENLIDQIISHEENDFAITADHGSTVGHKINKKEKKHKFEEAQHDGRCYYNKDRRHLNPSEDYVLYDDEAGRQWVISLNQQSLYNNSKYAVHGGATPEEVLVPVIIAQKDVQGTKIYRVKAVNLKVSGLEKNIKVEINPAPKDKKVRLYAKDGTDVEMTLDYNTNIWTGELKRGIEQDITIAIEEQIHTFRTIPETKMGDDLFDD